MTSRLQALQQHLTTIHNLRMAYYVLWWDQQVNMPPLGASARAAQLATLSRIAHERLTSDETGLLLDGAAREIAGMPHDSDEMSLVRVARREYESARRLPAALVDELARLRSTAGQVWERAKVARDFAMLAPYLERTFELKRREADDRGWSEHPYDALLGVYDPGLTLAEVRRLFEAQRPHLIALARAAPPSDAAPLQGTFSMDDQRAFCRWLAEQVGFRLDAGRLDESAHGFEIQFATGDVRLTTSYDPRDLRKGLYTTLHEAGHGMHAQGFAPSLDGTYLSDLELASAALQESQSRLWENMIGRSELFWRWLHPHVKAAFPMLRGTWQDAHRAANAIRMSPRRTESDEVTYNLHIMLRLELECALLEGRLRIAELPEAWNARMESWFGLTISDDAAGVLQDPHWAIGMVGYFPGYALGNLLAAQFYEAALAGQPDAATALERGDFAPLRVWLTEHIYQHGRKFTLRELTRRVLGSDIDPQPFLRYLERKVAALNA